MLILSSYFLVLYFSLLLSFIASLASISATTSFIDYKVLEMPAAIAGVFFNVVKGAEMKKGNDSKMEARIELMKTLKKAIDHADILNKILDDQHAMLMKNASKKAA